ncbi:capsid protein precursor pVI [Simian adenovirus DM-2014]|uniref:Pre-protein VI n=1 Tax=Simian adenovirus DM-2014 TaxID=1560346 RepID=A0A097IWC5_9ADEN|nr:capsid protein precursor pVI [Simian adenovirus DM-2014]AIT70981.1 capsid protein precursor pVI [Simian adenovirus DM-2014]
MEDVNFSSLAPRHGTRPYLGTWNDIGTSQLNGGAFNWSSIWSGLKNFGSAVKTYGNRAWNSSTGQLLRDKLKEQNFQQKVVDGLAAGINGVVDIANQAVQREINNRLDPRPVEEKLPELEKEPQGEKRPRPDLEETLVTKTEEPPSYEEAVKNVPSVSLKPVTYPLTKPILSMATPVGDVPVTSVPIAPPVSRPAIRPVAVATPRYSRSNNWQSTLNSIVGLGVKTLKRRRCYY